MNNLLFIIIFIIIFFIIIIFYIYFDNYLVEHFIVTWTPQIIDDVNQPSYYKYFYRDGYMYPIY
jgi:hypothetical protein